VAGAPRKRGSCFSVLWCGERRELGHTARPKEHFAFAGGAGSASLRSRAPLARPAGC